MKKKTNLSCAPRTAVAYARYSSAGQRDVSIDQQLRDIRAYAEREGYTIVHEYADHARSGFKNTSARSEFQAMIASAASGAFDTVLCWKVDRFGRNREDSAIYKGQLSRLGVSVVYVMEPIPEGAAGVLTEGMLEAIAEWYSRNLSENVRRGMYDNARNCLYNGSAVYGYAGVRNQRYQINEEQAAVVRQVFSLYIDGHPMADIVRLLNSSGQRAESGKLFTLNKIYNILKQERYLGIYIYGDYRIPGGMPAIIDPDTWEKAQRMKSKTSRHNAKYPVDFILTGKAFCGLCGSPLVGNSGTSSAGTVYYYYICQSRKHGSGCCKRSARKQFLEDSVINYILDHVLHDDSKLSAIADTIIDYQKNRADDSPLRSMEAELRSTETKIANMNRAIAEGIFSSSTVEMLHTLESTAASLRLSIESRRFAEGELLDRNRLLFWLSEFSAVNRTDPHDRRFLINTFVNSVYVYDDHYRLFLNTSDNCDQLRYEDLPHEPESLDSISLCSPNQTRPNFLLIEYLVRI